MAQLGELSVPGRVQTATFRAKVFGLQIKRAVSDLLCPVHKLAVGTLEEVGTSFEVVTGLWLEKDPRERALELGKVQNLRCAARTLDGTFIPAGRTFSFWKQVDRTTAAKGYVVGRQIEHGCLVPARGGGICQLTNSLYELALKAKCDIVERHPHTRKVRQGNSPDATVAWNHIDLRFRPKVDTVLRVHLTKEELIVRLEMAAETKERKLLPLVGNLKEANSCATCGQEACHLHYEARPTKGKTVWILDKPTPEFKEDAWMFMHKPDLLLLPIDGRGGKRPAYDWERHADSYRFATLQALARAWTARRLASEGPARRQAGLEGNGAIATALAKHIPTDATELWVSQSFLPFLWRDKHLGGRCFTVLMHGFPLFALQEMLDHAASRLPDQSTLTDFRAPTWLLRAEQEAIANADRIVTSHPSIAALYPEKSVLLPWQQPKPLEWKPGGLVAYLGPAIARKGSIAVRDAAKRLGIPIVLVGKDFEGEEFWQGVEVKRAGPNWLDDVCCVVQPSINEEQPRKLLQAQASGVPIIAGDHSGLIGVQTVPFGETEPLIERIKTYL